MVGVDGMDVWFCQGKANLIAISIVLSASDRCCDVVEIVIFRLESRTRLSVVLFLTDIPKRVDSKHTENRSKILERAHSLSRIPLI